MNKESIFWLIVTLSALAALGFLLGESDGDPPFNTADERHALAKECIGSHSGLEDHYHAEIRISVLNEAVAIPDDVGIDDRGCSMRPLHTHDSTGRIHLEFGEKGVEAPLEAFFDIWGKHMDSTGFDDHRIDAGHEFLMFVTEEGGERTQVTTFQEHIVEDGQVIELIYRAIE
ncbi:MAG: hypothetical protein VXZ04_05590 [Candidatus Thermoplasmatota archaeon]|nr:hypothetical protein [Candidatus Thermoplasmatota archaeon]